MLKRSLTVAALLFGGLIASATPKAIANTEVPITRIDFAGAGGDQFHRWGTFTVPDRDTTVSAYGGSLRRYEVHIAKMLEVAADQWCSRPDFKGVHYNYEAENGKRFLGKIYISCDLARNAVKTYGLGRAERTEIRHRGNPEIVNIPVLDLKGDKIQGFQNLVRAIRSESGFDI